MLEEAGLRIEKFVRSDVSLNAETGLLVIDTHFVEDIGDTPEERAIGLNNLLTLVRLEAAAEGLDYALLDIRTVQLTWAFGRNISNVIPEWKEWCARQ